MDELLAHHDDRLRQSFTVLGKHTFDAYTVARQLAWTRRDLPVTELNASNQMLAVNETAAHLDVLVLRGRVTRTSVDGVNLCTRVPCRRVLSGWRTDGIRARSSCPAAPPRPVAGAAAAEHRAAP